MKVGDLVKVRRLCFGDGEDEYAIALVVDTTNQAEVFELFELSGSYKGTSRYGTEEDWEVISESR